MAPLASKRNYRCVQSLQQFYSGGPFAVSSDASFIVCACGEEIKVVGSLDSSVRSTIEADSGRLTALALSPDDKFVFSAGESRQIRVWELETLKCVRSWKGHEGPVLGMTCHASGGLLATSGADKKVLVWDVDGGFCTHHFTGHQSIVTSLVFHPDVNKMLLFSGSGDATVRVWELSKKKCLAKLDKHFSAVTSIAVSEDGWSLLTAGRDKVVNLWDLHTYACISTIPTYEALESVCIINSGSQFASCLAACDLQAEKNKAGVHFVTVGEHGIVRIWNSQGAVRLYEQKVSDVFVSTDVDDDSRRGFIGAVLLPLNQGLLCVTADQQFLFYCPSGDVKEFNLNLNKRLIGSNGEITDLKFLDEEENYLAVATNIEQVRVYELPSMSCSYVLAGHTDIVLCLDTCISDSQKKLIVTGSKDNSVRLWESESQYCIGVGRGHMGAVGAIAFSKRSRSFIVSGSSDRTIKVWSLDGLLDDVQQPYNLKVKAVVAAHDKDINSLAVAPNDSLVCSGSQDRTACIWRLPELVHVVTLRGHKRGVWSVEFSPVDQCVITASGDKTVKIWTIADGSCLKTFEGHTSSVLRASFITRGTQFVSSGADGLVKLWSVKTNECIATYDQHEDKVWALAVGKKSEMLVTGGGDEVLNIWHDSTSADKEEAFRKEEELVLRGQELENAVVDADYIKAIRLAFELQRPHKLFELLSGLCRKNEDEHTIDKALNALSKDEFRLLFEYVRQWNTKPKLCHVAQYVLFRAFNLLPPTEIIQIKGITELLEALIPYSRRHFKRLDRLARSTFLLDYILTKMSVLEPDTDASKLKVGNSIQSSVNMEKQQPEQTSEEMNEMASKMKRKSSQSIGCAGSTKKSKGVNMANDAGSVILPYLLGLYGIKK